MHGLQQRDILICDTIRYREICMYACVYECIQKRTKYKVTCQWSITADTQRMS